MNTNPEQLSTSFIQNRGVCLFYFKSIHTRSHTIGISLQETMAHYPQLYILIKKMTVVVDNNRRPCPPYVDDKDVACVV